MGIDHGPESATEDAGVGLVVTGSCFTHACEANCTLMCNVNTFGSHIIFEATKNISRDDILTICHVSDDDPNRLEVLKEHYGIVCDCIKCSEARISSDL